jgi:hypothetical protein
MLRKVFSATVLIFCLNSAYAAENRVTGAITKIDCGDGTNLEITTMKKRHLEGVCYEKWCDQLCGERTEDARARTIGRKISASVRVVNTEEAESGSLANEFFHITLE